MRPYKIKGKVITIDFSKLDDVDVVKWAESIGVEYVDEIPNLDATVDIEITSDEFSDDFIKSEYMERFRRDEDAIARAYGYLAQGDVTAAMDLMSREFNLASPSHEKKLADLLSRCRARETIHAQN